MAAVTGSMTISSTRELLDALQAVRMGDFSVRLPAHLTGLAGKVADTFNEIVTANARTAEQLKQVGQTLGREGKTRSRVRLPFSTGAWADMEASINGLIDDLLWRRQRHANDLGRGPWRSLADCTARCRRSAAAG